ncbi:FtsX-like permease family protein [Roseiterribacter gracilis]|uniref:ABC transporter permease n=1 Tax=Roseiterribacter gracilis TaxID=2812848 RepID=A0A8S8X9H4_9PROT|nr:ABC transporter permease [Rhodospirillales bacterium TMPK1]
MVRNLLTTGLRVLWKDRLYAAINLVGLAVAFAATLLIALWIRYELNWEPFLQQPEQTRLILAHVRLPQNRGFDTLSNPVMMRAEFQTALGDRALVARFSDQDVVLSVGDRRSNEKVGFVDPEFFRIVTMQFLAGDPAHALDAPDSIVLSESAAIKFFGAKSPLGETIELQNRATARVTGVIADPPGNTMFRKTAFAASLSPVSSIQANEKIGRWSNFNAYELIRLQGATEADIRRELDRLTDQKYPEDKTGNSSHTFDIVALRDAHFVHVVDGRASGKTSLVTLAIVAVLIIAIAGVNFVNLATARAARRTREVGVRKSLGATRRAITLQLLTEPFLLTLAGLLLAFVLVETALPFLSDVLGAVLVFSYGRDWTLVLLATFVALLVGLLAGLYPALILSRLSPVEALRAAGRSGGGSSRLRQALVVAQFAASIGLIVVTIFIQQQAEHARDVNFTQIGGDPLVMINNLARLDDSTRKTMIERLNAEPALRGATAASTAQADTARNNDTRDDIRPGQQVSFQLVSVDPRFFPLHQFPLLAGRNLEAGRDEGQNDVILNATASKLFGFVNPQDAIGRSFGSAESRLTIIGVVPDFPLQSARENVGPLVFFHDPTIFRYAIVRVPGSSIRPALQAIDRIWRDAAPTYPIVREFADERLARIWRATQREADVLTGFALVAVLIGCLGLLGLAAYTAERRTKEIGIRKAMGASTADVVKLLVLQLTRPVIVANLLAWPVALWLVQRWLAGFADRVPIEPWPFLVASVGTLLLAWTVVSGHALAVARARPAFALRYE